MRFQSFQNLELLGFELPTLSQRFRFSNYLLPSQTPAYVCISRGKTFFATILTLARTGLSRNKLKNPKIFHKFVPYFKRYLQWNLFKVDTAGMKESVRFIQLSTLQRFFKDSLTAKQTNRFLVILSLLQRCPLHRVSALQRFHCIKTLLNEVIKKILSTTIRYYQKQNKFTEELFFILLTMIYKK